jgi:hypothetical protein
VDVPLATSIIVAADVRRLISLLARDIRAPKDGFMHLSAATGFCGYFPDNPNPPPTGDATCPASLFVDHYPMSTQEMLISEIRDQPEPILREVWHYLRFLARQREEEACSDVLPSRGVEQEVLDILDARIPRRSQLQSSVSPPSAQIAIFE